VPGKSLDRIVVLLAQTSWVPLRTIGLMIVLLLGCGHAPWVQPDEDWKRVESTNFIVHTDTSLADHEPIIARLEDVHEALLTTFFKDVRIEKMEVLLFDSASEFRGVAPEGDLAGYFMPQVGTQKNGVLVFPIQSEFSYVASVAAHELAHAFLNAVHPNLPAWLHEGFAKYIGAVDVIEDVIAFDALEIHGGYTFFADVVPVKKLFEADNRDFHGNANVDHYMTAWLFIRELMSTKVDDKKARFRAMVDRIAVAKNPAETKAAIEASFSVSVATIESRVRDFHARSRSGIGQAKQRSGMGVQVSRVGRKPLLTASADADTVRSLCLELRQRVKL
jgi:hypothetical protein